MTSVGNDVPIFINTGGKPDTIYDNLQTAGNVIIRSSLKVDGHTWKPVDPARVIAFVVEVRRARQG